MAAATPPPTARNGFDSAWAAIQAARHTTQETQPLGAAVAVSPHAGPPAPLSTAARPAGHQHQHPRRATPPPPPHAGADRAPSFDGDDPLLRMLGTYLREGSASFNRALLAQHPTTAAAASVGDAGGGGPGIIAAAEAAGGGGAAPGSSPSHLPVCCAPNTAVAAPSPVHAVAPLATATTAAAALLQRSISTTISRDGSLRRVESLLAFASAAGPGGTIAAAGQIISLVELLGPDCCATPPDCPGDLMPPPPPSLPAMASPLLSTRHLGHGATGLPHGGAPAPVRQAAVGVGEGACYPHRHLSGEGAALEQLLASWAATSSEAPHAHDTDRSNGPQPLQHLQHSAVGFAASSGPLEHLTTPWAAAAHHRGGTAAAVPVGPHQQPPSWWRSLGNPPPPSISPHQQMPQHPAPFGGVPSAAPWAFGSGGSGSTALPLSRRVRSFGSGESALDAFAACGASLGGGGGGGGPSSVLWLQQMGVTGSGGGGRDLRQLGSMVPVPQLPWLAPHNQQHLSTQQQHYHSQQQLQQLQQQLLMPPPRATSLAGAAAGRPPPQVARWPAAHMPQGGPSAPAPAAAAATRVGGADVGCGWPEAWGPPPQAAASGAAVSGAGSAAAEPQPLPSGRQQGPAVSAAAIDGPPKPAACESAVGSGGGAAAEPTSKPGRGSLTGRGRKRSAAAAAAPLRDDEGLLSDSDWSGCGRPGGAEGGGAAAQSDDDSSYSSSRTGRRPAKRRRGNATGGSGGRGAAAARGRKAAAGGPKKPRARRPAAAAGRGRGHFAGSGSAGACDAPGGHNAAAAGSGEGAGAGAAAGGERQSSAFRGVTKHRRSGRWESHIWIKEMGKQVYLGGYELEESAAEAYDMAALKTKGLGVHTNFDKSRYRDLLSVLHSITTEELVMAVRRQSQGFSRGSSRFRGVTAHPSGRWEARIGIPGSRHIYLGLYAGERDAARAYDTALVRLKGLSAATNYGIGDYVFNLAECYRANELIAARDPKGLLLKPQDLRPEFESFIKGGLAAVGLPLPTTTLERARRDTTAAKNRNGAGSSGSGGGSGGEQEGGGGGGGGAAADGAAIAAAAVAKVTKGAAP